MASKSITIRTPADLHEKIKKAAEEMGLTVTEWLLDAAEQALGAHTKVEASTPAKAKKKPSPEAPGKTLGGKALKVVGWDPKTGDPIWK